MRIVVFALCLLLASCAERTNSSSSSTPIKAPSSPKSSRRFWEFIIPPRPVVRAAVPLVEVGTIRLVNDAEGFVLIDATRRSMLSPSVQLAVFEEGRRVAVLRMTSLQAPPFVIADIVEGHPESGQRVRLLDSSVTKNDGR